MSKKLVGVLLLLGMVIAGQMLVPAVYAQQKEVTFAMLPQMSNAELFKAWAPVLKYLEEQTGVKFTQKFAKNFEEHVQWCKNGEIDFAYTNPVCYVQMAPKKGVRDNGHVALGIAVQPKGSTFYGEFISRTDNEDIKTIADIKGKTGWVVGYTSAGGYCFQQAYALDNGIDMTKDCEIAEAPGNKQEKVIMAVYNREVEFGCIRNGMLDKVKDRVDITQLKIFAETPRYPSWGFSAYNKLDPALIAKVQKALLSIPEDVFTKAALPGKVKAFEQASDASFDSLRVLADKLGSEY